MNAIIAYFSNRPVVANVLLFGLIFTGILIWKKIGKEELPEFAMNWVRITVPYRGASAEDVELFVTKPIEEKLKGVTALDEVQSTSSYGMSSFRISFESNLPNLQEKIQEVKDAVEAADLPRESDEPTYRQFRSSEKAIIDIGLFLKDHEILDVPARIRLQQYALAFKDKMLSLKEISGVDDSGYLRPELQIKVDPGSLSTYEVSMDRIQTQVLGQHVRQPIGSMKDRGESDVSLVGELDSVDRLEEVIITSGFQGQRLQLKQVAQIEQGFERNSRVVKVQGREGIVFNIKKSSNVDILSARDAVLRFIKKFKESTTGSEIDFVLMDDESYEIRNRISIISWNGLIGFALIMLVLFLFLDLKAGIWVGMGIPFCLAVTMVIAYMMGMTINKITLAGIIIVLGIVVDDAIIVAENISRKYLDGVPNADVVGTSEVLSPVVASVLTTCAAFIPLYYFQGHFGVFVKAIPTIVFLMLLASLLESFFILPAHMRGELPFARWFKKPGGPSRIMEIRKRVLFGLESIYIRHLQQALRFRSLVLIGFALLLGSSLLLFSKKMKYVMFPREETKDFRVKVAVPEGATKYETARKMTEVENVFLDDPHGAIVGVRSNIGQSRRGGQLKENEGSIIVEIVPRSERSISLNNLRATWQERIDKLEGFKEVKILKSRWGFDSGSPVEIQVRENNDQTRKRVTEALKNRLSALPFLADVEIERPVVKDEFALQVNKAEVSRLGIDFRQLASTLRAYIEGTILYTLNSGEEEVDVRLTSSDTSKKNIDNLLSLRISNQEGYLIPIKNLVQALQTKKPANIDRRDYKRTSMVYADIKPESKISPLEIARIIEEKILPEISQGVPSVVFEFSGEIKDSRDSQSDFMISVLMALGIIFILLVFLFNSIWTPFLIGAIIPFGVVGVILAFYAHGMVQFGFFASIGVLGMLGVVINDSIVLINKLEMRGLQAGESMKAIHQWISEMSATRLRAIIVTTVTTVAGLFPTAYGVAGYDSMLAEMMMAMCWGLIFGMFITLIMVPCLYSYYTQVRMFFINRQEVLS